MLVRSRLRGSSTSLFSASLLIILIFISYEEQRTPDIEGYNLRTIEFVEHRPLRVLKSPSRAFIVKLLLTVARRKSEREREVCVFSNIIFLINSTKQTYNINVNNC